MAKLAEDSQEWNSRGSLQLKGRAAWKETEEAYTELLEKAQQEK